MGESGAGKYAYAYQAFFYYPVLFEQIQILAQDPLEMEDDKFDAIAEIVRDCNRQSIAVSDQRYFESWTSKSRFASEECSSSTWPSCSTHLRHSSQWFPGLLKVTNF